MIDILAITGSIFLVIGAGYFAVQSKLFTSDEMGTLGKFVVKFALPALILRAVSAQPISEFANLSYFLAVLLATLGVFWIGYFWSRYAGARAATSIFSAMGMSCTNSGFVGLPILLIALPDVAAKALAFNMIIENLVMIPLVLIMAEYAQGDRTQKARLFRQIARRLALNPIFLALILALGLSASGLSLPTIIARPVDMLASVSAALSLVVIGGTLASVRLTHFETSVIRVSLGKLILHPLAVGALLFVASMLGAGIQDDQLVAAGIILAATPVMSIYPIIAQGYGEAKMASLAMLVMTVSSFLTMSIVMAIVLRTL